MTPLAVDATEVVITSLIPRSADGMSAEQRRHWDTNLSITLATLDEDFEIGESIQRGLASGTNQALTFGRNEGLLTAFNSWVERLLQAD
jgi:phenylpropionate dioxygenase-like ring-hydroxylating dioxygenase large terminal subunit